MEAFLTTTKGAASKKTETPSHEVQMLRRQVKSLSAENERLKKELAETGKRTSAPTLSNNPAPKKKARTAGQKKKLFEKWAKALVRESKKHKINNGYGVEPYQVTVKDAGVWSQQDFMELFDGQGKKIQPTPENKPTSVITILDFGDYEDVNTFFTDVGGMAIPETGYEVQKWRQRNFQKSYKSGDRDSSLAGMQVHYNKSKQALSFVFSLCMTDEDW